MRSYQEVSREAGKTARDELRKGLTQCTIRQQHKFKQMYAKGNLELSIPSSKIRRHNIVVLLVALLATSLCYNRLDGILYWLRLTFSCGVAKGIIQQAPYVIIREKL